MRNFEQIKRHLNGNSSDGDYAIFKERMREDKKLANDVVEYLNARNNINNVVQYYENAVPFYKNKIVWSMAAAVVVCLGGLFYYQLARPMTPGQLLGKPTNAQTTAPIDSLKNGKKN